ncbi:MAG: hypothetical protein AB1650_00545 [Candidatus Omnitrophota bacterium]
MPVNIELWIVVGFLFGLFVLGLVFLMSLERKKARSPRRVKPLKEKEQKDWRDAALRLEKHVIELRKESADWHKQVKGLQKDLEIYQKKYEDLSIKLDREKTWEQKESAEREKKNLRIRELENEVKRAESQLEKEHMEFVLIRRQNDDFRQETERQTEMIRQLNGDLEKAKAQTDVYRKEILELRAENKKLSKRHDDVQWIAKSVHMQVKDELRRKTEELEKLRSNNSN